MKKVNTSFSGSIPEAYDTYLRQLLFEFSARDLAERIDRKVKANSAILEIACGTGISTRRIREKLDDSISITATDISQPMIDFAIKKNGSLTNVSFSTADALDLPYDDEQFDAVACQFGIMFFPDKLKGLQEMFRVLKPGGHLFFNVWDSFENNKVAGIIFENLERYFENDPPQFLKVPFSYNDIPAIKTLISDAGFISTEHHIVSEKITGQDTHDVAKGFLIGNPNIVEINERATASADVIINSAMNAIIEQLGPEPIDYEFQEIVFTAQKP